MSNQVSGAPDYGPFSRSSIVGDFPVEHAHFTADVFTTLRDSLAGSSRAVQEASQAVQEVSQAVQEAVERASTGIADTLNELGGHRPPTEFREKVIHATFTPTTGGFEASRSGMPVSPSMQLSNIWLSGPSTANLTVEAGRPPAWLNYVARRLRNVASPSQEAVAAGLTSPDSKAIERSLVELRRVMRWSTPAPSVIPTVDGTILFSWHRPGWDVEVEVGSIDSEVWAQSDDQHVTIEGPLHNWQQEVVTILESTSAE